MIIDSLLYILFYVIVKKHTPEGTPQHFCLCINYRRINSLLPAVTPAVGTKKGAFTLMLMDLQSGYYHIKWDEESIPKRAFRKSEFQRLPFGLS